MTEHVKDAVNISANRGQFPKHCLLVFDIHLTNTGCSLEASVQVLEVLLQRILRRPRDRFSLPAIEHWTGALGSGRKNPVFGFGGLWGAIGDSCGSERCARGRGARRPSEC